MLDDHAHVMQVKLYKANTRGVTTYYLQDRIFDLEREVSSGYKDDGQDDNNNGADS